MDFQRKIAEFSTPKFNVNGSINEKQPPFEKLEKARPEKFWTSPPLYLVQILRWTYAVGLSPLRITKEEDFFVVSPCKIRKGLQLAVLLFYIAFLAFSFRNALACQSYITPMARLLVHFGDIAKVLALMYITWYKSEAIQKVLNNFLSQRSLLDTPGSRVFNKVGIFRKSWIWFIVLGYPVQSYSVYILTNSSTGFGPISDPFLTCQSSAKSTISETFSALNFGHELLWRVAYSLKHMYVVLTDAYLLATIGAYAEFVADFISTLEKGGDLENDDWTLSSGIFTAFHPSEIPKRFCSAQERMLGYIEDFQSTISSMNEAMGAVIAVWFFTNLPYHVFKGIPLNMDNSDWEWGTLILIFTRGYTIQFYLGLAIAAYKATKVTNVVRSWISKVKRKQDQKQPELQLLFMEANAFHDFALNLNGLGSLNSTLFLSTISATVTYTLINYQFSLYKSV